jgi:hypothetical protein
MTSLDEKTDAAVHAYANEIIANAKERDPLAYVVLDIEQNECGSEPLYASKATITSELGVVIVFPNFKKKSAAAAILNVGKYEYLEKEGFDEEFINNSTIFSTLLHAGNPDHVKTLGYYLTTKIDGIGRGSVDNV